MDNTENQTEVPSPEVRLLPLIENGSNEKVANMLARLIGGDERSATSALIILTGLQKFLDSGIPETTGALWEPLIEARKLKKEWGGQAYRKATELAASAHNTASTSHTLYMEVCQILLGDPEQEKFKVDGKK
jgi:hypothetical protein